jgi:urease accessory protein
MKHCDAKLDPDTARQIDTLDLPVLSLPFHLRSKSRFKAQLNTGQEIGVFMLRGSILRGGDVLVCDDAQLVRVHAADEDVLEVRGHDAQDLARAAYHLGNRHVQLQVGPEYLRLDYDHVLEQMLIGMGLHTRRLNAAFEPEAGAYGHAGHAHDDH